jgi:hypothetical protein
MKLSEPLRSRRLGKLSGPMLGILFSAKNLVLTVIAATGEIAAAPFDSRLAALRVRQTLSHDGSVGTI